MTIGYDSSNPASAERPKNTRRVRCPKTGDLIESAQYHKNKKEGMYKDIK
jgi:hypothetical protein